MSKLSFLEFINKYQDLDPNILRLKFNRNDFDFDLENALLQIEGRKKFKNKFAEFFSFPSFLIPDLTAAEQASHQAVAIFHSSLLQNERKVLDMTSGFGVDSMMIAPKVGELISCEISPERCKILKHNARIIGISNISVINEDSFKYISKNEEYYDTIYVDPSRRENGKRLYNLRDCSPDVVNLQDLLLRRAKRILIKASPLLDVTQTIKDFSNISSIWAIGVKGECKELLIELKSEDAGSFLKNQDEIKIQAVNLDYSGNILFLFEDVIHSVSAGQNYSSKELAIADIEDLESGSYLLEPSPMLMKLSPWNSIIERYSAKKLGKSSHLFVTKKLPKNFPGRVTKIEGLIRKQDRKKINGMEVSVISRNHPMSVEEIRKSYKLKEGDSNFLYATRLADKPIMLLTNSILC